MTNEPWYLAFHDLMPYRVREILLVSSRYDAFTLEEDGRLTERLFVEYSELNLSASPRITHATSGAQAMELLALRRFDLVIAMMRLDDIDLAAFGRRVKEALPAMPVVLLAFSEAEVQAAPIDQSVVDGVFVWTGDARILLAIIKLVEDRKNVDHDTQAAEVRVILVVEDSAHRYSSFLSLLYAELMVQSASLIAEGMNEIRKLMRMRARPKILLATSFEEAVDLYERYRENVFALISDVRFPRSGTEDPEAGFALVRLVRAYDPDLPVLVQSAELETEKKARELDVHWAHKGSATLLRRIREFMKESMGFGDFVFRLPGEERTEVGRARNVFEMEEMLRTVPAASVEYHGARNHFSLWLEARSMFALARELRPRTIAELGGVEASRAHIIRVLRDARHAEQEGGITDLSTRKEQGEGSHFLRLGKGSIGGKARGIAFVNAILAYERSLHRPDLEMRTPKTVAIGTDEFDRFVEDNALGDLVHKELPDGEVLRRFLDARLSDALVRDMQLAWKDLQGPLAVRSSSLLEDAHFQPFAGIYSTYMLATGKPSTEEEPARVGFDELCRAIKAVWASTYLHGARAYLASTNHSLEDEKMAVVIQEMVGQAHGRRFYPHFSGVALSYNYYPFGNQRADEGIALVALGLGHTVVQGGAAVQFSPSTPNVQPQFTSPSDFLANAQTQFYAIDLERTRIDFLSSEPSSIRGWDLSAAEEDGTLSLVGSVYDARDDRIRDDLTRPGPRLVTFANVLKWNALPLAEGLATLLRVMRSSFGCAVEIELAVDVPKGAAPVLYVLQVRPQATQLMQQAIQVEGYPEERVLCRTGRSLGHGVMRDVLDIVYVKRNRLESSVSPAIAVAVGEVNAQLQAERRPYLLVGPGRWGTTDPRLGVPVEWSQIAGARVIVETSPDDRLIEPSQGSHFFHNITSLHVGYLTVSGSDRFDRAWLDAQPSHCESAEVRHVRLQHPLHIVLDGRSSTGLVLEPE